MYNLSLLGRDGEVQKCHGLNWGQNSGNHTTSDDACIAIRAEAIRNDPHLFPPVGHIKEINVIWDDGVEMTMLLEGTQKINGLVYPKQMSVKHSKKALGEYIKNRMGIPLGQPIWKEDLTRYGRTFIGVTLINGVYNFNFS